MPLQCPTTMDYKGSVLFIFVILTYFMWMDLALYFRVQERRPSLIPIDYGSYNVNSMSSSAALSSSSSAAAAAAAEATQMSAHTITQSSWATHTPVYSPFNGLTVKLMMLDHMNHYFHIPASIFFNEVTRFSEIFYFITPNMISFFDLFVALLAAKLVTSESLVMRQLSVAAFEVRNFLDGLDGVVYRARVHQVDNMSNVGTFGYAVDGFVDTVGSAAMCFGLLWHLRRHLSSKGTYTLLPSYAKDSTGDATPSLASASHFRFGSLHFSTPAMRRIFYTVMCFGLQLSISGAFWNRYISNYHDLLEDPASSYPQAVLQNEIIKSSLMWIIIWFWRIANAHALMELLLLSIFIDKVWEFLTWIQYIGLYALISLIILTEIHYHDVQNFISVIAKTSGPS